MLTESHDAHSCVGGCAISSLCACLFFDMMYKVQIQFISNLVKEYSIFVGIELTSQFLALAFYQSATSCNNNNNDNQSRRKEAHTKKHGSHRFLLLHRYECGFFIRSLLVAQFIYINTALLIQEVTFDSCVGRKDALLIHYNVYIQRS